MDSFSRPSQVGIYPNYRYGDTRSCTVQDYHAEYSAAFARGYIVKDLKNVEKRYNQLQYNLMNVSNQEHAQEIFLLF